MCKIKNGIVYITSNIRSEVQTLFLLHWEGHKNHLPSGEGEQGNSDVNAAKSQTHLQMCNGKSIPGARKGENSPLQ